MILLLPVAFAAWLGGFDVFLLDFKSGLQGNMTTEILEHQKNKMFVSQIVGMVPRTWVLMVL